MYGYIFTYDKLVPYYEYTPLAGYSCCLAMTVFGHHNISQQDFFVVALPYQRSSPFVVPLDGPLAS